MKPVRGNEELKQRLNLSSHAMTVLQRDMEDCAPGATLSGFLNDIFDRFHPLASASIGLELQRYRQKLAGTLRVLAQEQATLALDRLTQAYQQELTDRMRSYPKGESLLFRLNKKNHALLYGDDRHPGMESAYYPRPSQYLKALFEEFTRLPGARREAFYFAGNIRMIHGAIKSGNVLQIHRGQRCFWLRPYALEPDTEASHLYLTGLSRPAGEPQNQERIASFRLSYLQEEIQPAMTPDAPLTRDDRLDIEARIRKNGVQYLLGEDDPPIRLRFHDGGAAMFRRKAHLRPVPAEISAEGIYTFHCSAMQIENYFFTFGAQVEILEPEGLRQRFAEGYRQANRLYADSDENS